MATSFGQTIVNSPVIELFEASIQRVLAVAIDSTR
jgi:hypothetical protein